MNTGNIADLIRFSEQHKWRPRSDPDLARRFLTELISDPSLIFELYDESGLLAVAVLLDKIDNLANDACLEILGVRGRRNLPDIFSRIIEFAKEKTPTNRNGFQIDLPAESAITEKLLVDLGLRHYFDTYDMVRSDISGILYNSPPEIVEALAEDCDRIFEVVRESFAQSPDTSIPNRETWQVHFLKSPRSHYYLWKRDEEIVGFANLVEGEAQGESEVRTIGVLPQARGKGIGWRLLAHCLSRSFDLGRRTCRLTVAVQNTEALGIYVRAGFKIVGKSQCYRRSKTFVN